MKLAEPTIVIDGTDLLVGRVATAAAKHALGGESVAICNCGDLVMSGSKKSALEKYKSLRRMGQPTKGPFIPRSPDRFVRRIVRGMIPYKKPRGAEAFRRVMCYRRLPEEWKSRVMQIDKASAKKLTTFKQVKISELCRELGGK